jgi:hypothetical protein
MTVKKTAKKLKTIKSKSHWELKAEKTVAKKAGTSRRGVALRWANGKSAVSNK